MRNFRRVTLVVFVLVFVLLTLTFVLENQQSISLLLLGWPLPEVPISIAIIFALLVGMLIGPLFTFLFGRARRQRQRHSI
ncbi:lipopolysaccharide assembly protein LapA domain-containing protein [Pseudomonas mandelii]|jgi:uncharacterized integral membrane protein|uniref:Lipopolysaccharide assembly protein A domain-containing protein n=1 Tax=Pseudomonas mandelii TaxID=75612 RepID=A0ABY0V9N2_9PSED|nr:lipopolysaccharide assembly protein LapA domain-containing protein [Pseudomonas mandelii]TWS10652.1 LapA family protein [Pseudomonas mandelii]SDU00352.1 Protein of unknown function [Pseudomonas mandelii]